MIPSYYEIEIWATRDQMVPSCCNRLMVIIFLEGDNYYHYLILYLFVIFYRINGISRLTKINMK